MSLLAHKRRRRPELNLVPLIDVLVMLIFFAFVTMQFKSMATLNITLPKVETAGKNEFKGTVTIGIDKDGQVSFNGGNVTDEQLLGLFDRTPKFVKRYAGMSTYVSDAVQGYARDVRDRSFPGADQLYLPLD